MALSTRARSMNWPGASRRAVPENLVALRRDLEQNFKGVLQSQLARLDLVTREEFDVQSAVLRRTREKLAALERRLAALEGVPAPLAQPSKGAEPD
jgi:BMFP domain-containing protein YqiC